MAKAPTARFTVGFILLTESLRSTVHRHPLCPE
jgi:hypothetical protein